MIVLGVESSCDETGLALYDTEQGLLAHALHSQIAMHQEYGGVVPELASRDHIRRALPLLTEVLSKSGLEKQQIEALVEKKNCVIALGGGALLDPDNRSLVSALGCVVYLKTSPEELWKRVQARGIPAYLDPEKPEKAFLALAEKRVADYEAIATATIDTANLSLEEIVDRVAKVVPTST